MSFAEKHKAWLLPVLGAGVLAVLWYNVQAFQPKPPAPPAAGDAPTAGTAAPAAAAPVPSPAPAAPAPAAPAGDAAGLWDDLKPLAAVPPNLGDLGPLESLARGVLPDSLLRETATEAARLRAPRLWQPDTPPRPGTGEGRDGDPAPNPDLVVHLPEGGRAWFDGAGYRERESLRGSPWRVHRILPRAVELQGPGGVALKPVHPPTSSGASEETR